jgi:hypothetical protein
LEDEETGLEWEEFLEWQWFLPELLKARKGDLRAFKPANPFEDDSVEAELFNVLTTRPA